jgi:hypothetical protein
MYSDIEYFHLNGIYWVLNKRSVLPFLLSKCQGFGIFTAFTGGTGKPMT